MGGVSTKFSTGTLRFEVQPLNLLFPWYPRHFIFSALIFQFKGIWNRGGKGGWGVFQQSFLLGRSALRSNPLTFYFPGIHVSEDLIKI